MVTSTYLTEVIIEVKDISKLEEVLYKVEEVKKSHSNIKINIRVTNGIPNQGGKMKKENEKQVIGYIRQQLKGIQIKKPVWLERR